MRAPIFDFMRGEVDLQSKGAYRFFLSGCPDDAALYGEQWAGATQDILMVPERGNTRVKLGGDTVLARGRVVTVVRRMGHSLGGGRSDGLPVGICVVQSLQHLVEFCVVIRMVFHVL